MAAASPIKKAKKVNKAFISPFFTPFKKATINKIKKKTSIIMS